jgi:hypothetical protein
MKWMIGIFVLVIVVTKLAFSQPAPSAPPVIYLDAGPHTITQNVTCVGDNVFTVATYVDGQYLMTVTNRPAPPSGFAAR